MVSVNKELTEIVEEETIQNMRSNVDHSHSTLKYGGWGALGGSLYAVGRYAPYSQGFWNWVGNASYAIINNPVTVVQGVGYGMIFGFALYLATRWFRNRFRNRRRERNTTAETRPATA